MTISELYKEWDCLLLVYAALTPVGKIVAKQRIKNIRNEIKAKHLCV